MSSISPSRSVCPPLLHLALCSMRLTHKNRIKVFPCLWLPVWFSQWASPAGDRRQRDGEVGCLFPCIFSSWAVNWLGCVILLKATANIRKLKKKESQVTTQFPAPWGLGGSLAISGVQYNSPVFSLHLYVPSGTSSNYPIWVCLLNSAEPLTDICPKGFFWVYENYAWKNGERKYRKPYKVSFLNLPS